VSEARRLGRGLEALLGPVSKEQAEREGNLRDLPVTAIRPNPFQPRTRVDEEPLKELTFARHQPMVIHLLARDELEPDLSGDFRLVDRRVLNELKSVNDDQPYLRGTIATLGFNQIGIPYDRDERRRGESKFTLRQLFGLALDGILNHSIVPLRIATYLGLLIALFTFAAIAFYIIGALFFARTWPPGFATITVLLLASLSLNALFLGVIGEYLGRIYRHMKRGSLTIIEEEVDPASGQRPAEGRTQQTATAPQFHGNR